MDVTGILSRISYSDVTIFMVFLLILWMWIRSRRPSDYPPGPTPLPIIGNFYNLGKQDLLLTCRDLRKTYGDIFSLSLGKYWVIIVNGSENLRELMVKRGDKTTDRPNFYIFKLRNNKGIVASGGSVWKHQRTFAISKLRDFGFGKRSFESNVTEEIGMFMNLLESYKGQPFDMSGILNTSMSNNVMSIVLGRRFEYDDPKFKNFIKMLNENISNAAFAGPLNFVPILANVPGDPFGAASIARNAERMDAFFKEEIKEHEKTLDEHNIRDFIDCYLLQMKESDQKENIYTGDQLLAVIGNLFAAGTETTATTILWTIMYILNDPSIQKKMWKEIEDKVGSSRLPTMSDKPKLPYCEAVCLESLRLGNIVPMSLPHSVSEDIHYNGFLLPKGSVIMPSLDSVAHDESLFPDSERFKPERFIDDNGKVCGQDKVLTFSLGRRVCLGESLARMELFLYLTALVQRFEFLPPEGEGPPLVKGHLALTYSPVLFKCRAVHRS